VQQLKPADRDDLAKLQFCLQISTEWPPEAHVASELSCTAQGSSLSALRAMKIEPLSPLLIRKLLIQVQCVDVTAGAECANGEGYPGQWTTNVRQAHQLMGIM